MTRSFQQGAEPVPTVPAPRSATLTEGVRVHVVQTGWVSVKRPHYSFDGMDGLALPALVAARRWTPWLPILASVIEHPGGVVVVDTGETARMVSDPDWPACDGVTGWFYRNNLRFTVRPSDEIGPQMRALGLDPEAVETVVMTHLHSDHIGGMGHFPNARFLVSRRDGAGHAGALLCRVPDRSRLIPVEQDGPPVDAFSTSHALSRDRSLLCVPTPGHTAGHQSVLMRLGGRSWLLAGDAVFDEGQVLRQEMAGISEDRAAARKTLAVLRRQMEEHATRILPAHDGDSMDRLAAN